MTESSIKLEAWSRLAAGESLDRLALRTIRGRVDMTGLTLPAPAVAGRFRFQGIPMQAEHPAVLRSVHLQDLDFSGGVLPGLRLFDCEIENCRFTDCQLDDLRLWSTKVRNTSFESAKLRRAVLGGVDRGRGCAFHTVDFSRADLRETIYKVTAFENCLFKETKLANVDFQGSSFVDCSFQCELRNVIFYRYGFNGEQFPPNEMVDTDFTGATLRDVGFRGLLLDRVRFPKDDDHIVIKNFAHALSTMKQTFEKQNDKTAKVLVKFIEMHEKWTLADQVQGIVSAPDLVEVAGEEGKERFIAAIPVEG